MRKRTDGAATDYRVTLTVPQPVAVAIPAMPSLPASVRPLCYNSGVMALTLDEVRHIAHLARLQLTPEEENRYREQLSAILDHAARLARVDTTAVPPTATVLPLHAPLRPDEPCAGLSLKRILANAPASEEDMFLIPPVFDEGS